MRSLWGAHGAGMNSDGKVAGVGMRTGLVAALLWASPSEVLS